MKAGDTVRFRYVNEETRNVVGVVAIVQGDLIRVNWSTKIVPPIVHITGLYVVADPETEK